MGTSRDIAGALNFNSGLVPMAMDDDMSDMGMTGDPPVSESQRKAMFAAKSGNSTLGIPQKVGAEFAKADPGGKLPTHAKDEDELASDTIHPDFNKVKHLASVQAAVREYKEAYKNNRGTYENGGRQQKEAENNLNNVIEKALSPKGAKDTEEGIATKLYGPQNPDGGPGGPDNAVNVHDKVTGYEPRKGRWGGRVGHSHANDGGPGLETAKAENNESGTGSGSMPTGRRGGRASPHLVSGQSMDGGPGSGPKGGGSVIESNAPVGPSAEQKRESLLRSARKAPMINHE